MDTLEWKGFRFTERWQHLYNEFVESRWAALLARLEHRDRLLEDPLHAQVLHRLGIDLAQAAMAPAGVAAVVGHPVGGRVLVA